MEEGFMVVKFRGNKVIHSNLIKRGLFQNEVNLDLKDQLIKTAYCLLSSQSRRIYPYSMGE